MYPTERDKILRRKAALWKERSSWDQQVRDISDFILPRSSRFTASDRNRSSQSDWNLILDNTGTMAHSTLSAGLMAGMTSPARPWFRLATPDLDLMEYEPVKVWLYKVTQKMLAIFAKSNTYRALKTSYGQLGAAGVSATVVVDNFDTVLHHYPLVYGQYALGLDHLGRVDTLCREMTKTVAQLIESFGREACSQTVRNLYDNANYDAPVEVVHMIEPRKIREYGKRDALNMPFRSCYIEVGANEDKYLRESGFQEFPALCPRWDVDGDDTYSSRWPGAVALGDVKQLQHQQLAKGKAIDYQVDPPLQVPSNVKASGMDRFPGGVTYVDSVNTTGGIRSLYEVNLDAGLLLSDIQDVRMRIDRGFYKDLFLMLAQDDRSGITAREVAERHSEKLLMLGPVLENLQGEQLQPLVELTFAKMLAAGMFTEEGGLPPPPELAGQSLDIEFVSTLAQAQRAVASDGLDKFIGTIGSLASIKPEALDRIDADQVVEAYADALGIDPSVIIADDKVALIRDQRAKQQQSAAMEAMAPALKDAASAAKSASETEPAAGLLDGFTGYT